jgi:hypothetical protein
MVVDAQTATKRRRRHPGGGLVERRDANIARAVDEPDVDQTPRDDRPRSANQLQAPEPISTERL